MTSQLDLVREENFPEATFESKLAGAILTGTTYR
jgi:hypothetical protein